MNYFQKGGYWSQKNQGLTQNTHKIEKQSLCDEKSGMALAVPAVPGMSPCDGFIRDDKNLEDVSIFNWQPVEFIEKSSCWR